MSNHNIIERRTSERFDQKGYIKVLVTKSKNVSITGREFSCKICDISSGGLQMVVHTNIPIGTIVELHVVFTDPPAEFKHTAAVAWVKENNEDIIKTYRIGIGFTSTVGEGKHDWEDMIRSRVLGAGGLK